MVTLKWLMLAMMMTEVHSRTTDLKITYYELIIYYIFFIYLNAAIIWSVAQLTPSLKYYSC